MSPKKFVSHELASTCPWCLTDFDLCSSSDFGEVKPKRGQVALCMHCGQFGVFDRKLRLLLPTDEEAADIANNETCRSLLTAWALTVGVAGTPPSRH